MSIKASRKAPGIKAFFDHDSHTISYVVTDVAMKKAAIIDSVLGFDYASGTISYGHADTIIDYVITQNIDVEWLIETHVHADHLSAAPYIQQKLGGKIGISERISEVQTVFGINIICFHFFISMLVVLLFFYIHSHVCGFRYTLTPICSTCTLEFGFDMLTTYS